MATVDLIPVLLDETQWAQVAYDLQYAKTRTANRHAAMIREQVERRHRAPSAPEGLRDRDYFGRLVREEWVRYCIETGDTKPSHVAPWDELSEWDKEADRRIADAVLAVLAVLPPAPRVDEITIPRELAERAENALRHYQASTAAEADADAIRAMLEGTA